MQVEFLFPVFSIILIDLVLGGDNAVVIGLASRNLPVDQRKKAVLIGTAGAVVLRILFTAAATLLLRIPLLMAIGGLLLTWIAFKLLTQETHHEVAEGKNLVEAIRTIIIADGVMSLDNVIAVAGAAHGNIWLVVFGLVVSIPIVVFGSQIVASLMQKYPVIVYIGAGILGWTAGSLIAEDKVLHSFVGEPVAGFIPVAITALVLATGFLKNQRREPDRENAS